MPPPIALFTAALFAAFILGFFVSARKTDPADRVGLFLVFPMAVCLIMLFWLKIQWSVFDDHNWERLQTPIALARGFPIYHAMNDGPILIAIYGPFSALGYFPAGFASSPSLAMKIAESLLILWFFLPPLAFCLADRRDPGNRNPFYYRLFVFFIFAYSVFISAPLRDAGLSVHVDGPTLGLATISCLFLYFRQKEKGEPGLFLSALFLLMAVWSKQVTVFLLPAFTFYLFLAEGKKTAARYAVYLLICAVLVSGGLMMAFDPQRMLFNMFTIPGVQGLQDKKAVFVSALRFLFEGATVFIPTGLAVAALFLSRNWRFKEGLRLWKGSLFLFAAVFMIPISLLSNSKLGGSINTLGYPCYFFLLAATAGFLELRAHKGMRILLALFASTLLCVEIAWCWRMAVRLPKQVNHAEIAFEYIRRHPGEAYFPRLGVLNILAENKAYHASAALRDRGWARMPVKPEHFRAFVPERMKFFAFEAGYDNDKGWLDPFLPDYIYETRDPELPGFLIYKNSK